MSTLNDLVEKVVRDMAHDLPIDSDIHTLMQRALDQQDTIEMLAEENRSLSAENEVLRKRLDAVEPFSHLSQYAEGSL